MYFHLPVIISTNACHCYTRVSLLHALKYSNDTLVMENVNRNYLDNINLYTI